MLGRPRLAIFRMQKMILKLAWVKRKAYGFRGRLGMRRGREEKENPVSHQPQRPRTRPYSVEEAAEKAGVDDKTLRKEIEKGKVKAIRMGRRILIPCVPFDALIELGELH